MRHFVAAFICVLFPFTLPCAPAAEGEVAPNKRGPIVAGNLTINPRDIIAVYRPIEQQSVAVYIGKPGQAVQTILFKDSREAAAVFNDIWNNDDVTKNPGDEDPRPLTRMLPKTAERRAGVLVLNLQRVLAMTWENSHHNINIYFDLPLVAAFIEPNTGDEHHHLDIENVRDDNDSIMAAYKLSVLPK
jgi:hypothetical protein